MAAWRTLIEVAELVEHLDDADWVLVDCRFDLADPQSGASAYRAGHVPGAVYADLDRDLSGTKLPGKGRHPLPDPTELAECLGRWGVGADTQVVAYDAGPGVMASRLWWLLRWLGHQQVAVLNGGLKAWTDGGNPISNQQLNPPGRRFEPVPDDQYWVDCDSLARQLQNGESLLVDARAVERFRGEVEPIDPVAGHVPGASNMPFEANIGADGRYLSADDIRDAWLQRLSGRSPSSVVHMCGSGVTACVNVLAMEHAGLAGTRLYAGSWSEWISDPSRPVAVGGE